MERKPVAIAVIIIVSCGLLGAEVEFKNETNPLKLFLNGLLYIYRNFITNQDVQECQFEPSCSKFALLSLKIADPFQALLMVSDRFQRCNPFAYMYYKKAYDGLHLYDPPQRHKLWGKGSLLSKPVYTRIEGKE